MPTGVLTIPALPNDVSNADLLKYQIELSINSLTATITSSIVKERSDTLKAVVQKF